MTTGVPRLGLQASRRRHRHHIQGLQVVVKGIDALVVSEVGEVNIAVALIEHADNVVLARTIERNLVTVDGEGNRITRIVLEVEAVILHAPIEDMRHCKVPAVAHQLPRGNGDSVAVLLAKSSPVVGHMAILIQIHGGENDGKWALWSKNGENKTWSQSVVDLSDDKGVRVWNSPQEFLNMNDEKYEDAYVIPTTNEQDKQITEGFRKSQEINYDLLEANCSIAVQSGLKAGGLKDGSLSRLEKIILKYSPTSNIHKAIIELSPVHIFSRIRNQNKNGTWLKRQK